ncbi:D-lactate dehydrogenase 2 mitochondrial precursor [Thamnocephalis sphaerospora]|uniref:D-lactate dehydrogenase (cytochrome) n=1 Tax=Thamnocephalis sphaerospora TaxID=78915 RepID=A0A4P9XVY8_9FUNG|nr:D-lactate dehydrogenase 2 mitochondrial precursor [Thamnocephalis sphaerospora]|eukprot:RKP10458.1 D-lactate dehydrogenase 2 mitochondrial precursor [Thamnocephalis sphaerospora]
MLYSAGRHRALNAAARGLWGRTGTAYFQPVRCTVRPSSTASVAYTSDKYPSIQRRTDLKKVSAEDVAFFRSVLPPTSVITNEDDLFTYNVDWMRKYRGRSPVVLLPKTTDQVSKLLAYCNQQRLAVVPQGGNTGLVGGGVPVFDEIVISTNLMNQVRSFDDVSGVVACDAGCILEVLDGYLGERGFMMPLDLGAKGSCHVGGNVAANAGGLRFLRYGSLHGTVLGVEAVLPDGTILDNMSTLRKDNTGYDLKQLFIGSEGTLGLVTGVTVSTPRRPNASSIAIQPSVNVAMVGVESFEKVQATFRNAKGMLSEVLSAFEFWDSHAAGLVRAHAVNKAQDPLSAPYPFYVLMETHGSNKEHDDAKLNAFLEHLMENEVVADGVVAQDEAQIKSLWSMRESIPEACSKAGAVYKYDVSIPVPKLYELVEDMRSRLESMGLMGDLVKDVIGYGHMGDGNLHLNITASTYDKRVTDAIEPYVYEWVASHNGSISAEHGLGLMKAHHIGYSKSAAMVNLMQQIKQLVDPNGIMNPYKYFPERA